MWEDFLSGLQEQVVPAMGTYLQGIAQRESGFVAEQANPDAATQPPVQQTPQLTAPQPAAPSFAGLSLPALLIIGVMIYVVVKVAD